jgi:hypothetical protein
LRGLDNEWVEIRSGKSVFKIVGMDAKEFPDNCPVARDRFQVTDFENGWNDGTTESQSPIAGAGFSL